MTSVLLSPFGEGKTALTIGPFTFETLRFAAAAFTKFDIGGNIRDNLTFQPAPKFRDHTGPASHRL
jgi:hypothetical protein